MSVRLRGFLAYSSARIGSLSLARAKGSLHLESPRDPRVGCSTQKMFTFRQTRDLGNGARKDWVLATREVLKAVGTVGTVASPQLRSPIKPPTEVAPPR